VDKDGIRRQSKGNDVDMERNEGVGKKIGLSQNTVYYKKEWESLGTAFQRYEGNTMEIRNRFIVCRSSDGIKKIGVNCE